MTQHTAPAMKLASVIHRSALETPPRYDTVLLPTSPFSPPTAHSRCLCFCFPPPPPRSNSIPSGRCRCSRKYYSVVACSRKTEQQDEASTSERETSSGESRDGINYFKNSQNLSSTGDSDKRIPGHENHVTSIRTVALCVLSAVAFGVGLGFEDGVDKAFEFFAGPLYQCRMLFLSCGILLYHMRVFQIQTLLQSFLLYLLEQSLSVDNLFVFVLIFKYFKVPLMYQNRVLSYGIAGAIFFRLSLILLGTATLQRFEAVNLLLAAILLFSAFKLFSEDEEDTDLSDNFIVKTCQRFIPVTSSYDGNQFITVQDGIWKATPLLLTLAVIELSDIAFAVDSIPAVFGVTRDPFVVFTSNLFAILGLRSLYTLISESMAELEYLQPAIAVVLGFIGCKMILDFFGFHVSTEVSLGFVATSLSAGVLLSLLKKSD